MADLEFCIAASVKDTHLAKQLSSRLLQLEQFICANASAKASGSSCYTQKTHIILASGQLSANSNLAEIKKTHESMFASYPYLRVSSLRRLITVKHPFKCQEDDDEDLLGLLPEIHNLSSIYARMFACDTPDTPDNRAYVRDNFSVYVNSFPVPFIPLFRGKMPDEAIAEMCKLYDLVIHHQGDPLPITKPFDAYSCVEIDDVILLSPIGRIRIRWPILLRTTDIVCIMGDFKCLGPIQDNFTLQMLILNKPVGIQAGITLCRIERIICGFTRPDDTLTRLCYSDCPTNGDDDTPVYVTLHKRIARYGYTLGFPVTKESRDHLQTLLRKWMQVCGVSMIDGFLYYPYVPFALGQSYIGLDGVVDEWNRTTSGRVTVQLQGTFSIFGSPDKTTMLPTSVSSHNNIVHLPCSQILNSSVPPSVMVHDQEARNEDHWCL